MIDAATQQLRHAGIRAEKGKAGVLRVLSAGAKHEFVVVEQSRSPRPSEMSRIQARRPPEGAPLLVSTYVSESVGQLLSRKGWSWADTCGNWDIRAPGLWLQRRMVSSPPKLEQSTLPKSGRGLAMVRWLIHLAPEQVSATELAERAGVSQPRASQLLKQLVAADLVAHPSRFQWTVQRQALLKRFLAEYPGPRGTRRYFYTLKAPNDAAIDLMEAVGKRGRAFISGDVAADLLAPHKVPEQLLAYQASVWNKVPDDWVEATGPHDANVVIVSASDDSVATLSQEREFKGTTLTLADPTQILWDLQHAGGDDRHEATERLATWLLSNPYTP